MAKHGGRKRIPLLLGSVKSKKQQEKEQAAEVATQRRLTRWLIVGGAGILLLLVAVFIYSCRGVTPPGPPKSEDDLVRLRVGQMSSAASSPTRFKEYFAAGAAVPSEVDRQRYRRLSYDLVSASVSGNTATVRVRVRDDESPKPLGEVEWTFTKEGDTWKAATVSLP